MKLAKINEFHYIGLRIASQLLNALYFIFGSLERARCHRRRRDASNTFNLSVRQMKVMMRRSARALSRNQNYIQMGANIHVILCTIHRNPLSKTLCTLEIRWLFKIIHLYLLAVRVKTFTDVRWLRQNTMLLTHYVAVRWFHKNIYFQCVKFMTECWTLLQHLSTQQESIGILFTEVLVARCLLLICLKNHLTIFIRRYIWCYDDDGCNYLGTCYMENYMMEGRYSLLGKRNISNILFF